MHKCSSYKKHRKLESKKFLNKQNYLNVEMTSILFKKYGNNYKDEFRQSLPYMYCTLFRRAKELYGNDEI